MAYNTTMKLLYHLTLLLLLVLTSCNLSTTKQDHFETSLCKCIYEEYRFRGVDLKNEFQRYETYLVDNQALEDRTGKSYIQLFKDISQGNKIELLKGYLIENLNPRHYTLYDNCISTVSNEELYSSNSKIKELHHLLDSAESLAYYELPIIARRIQSVTDASDFKKELYQLYALYTFYTIAYRKYEMESVPPVIKINVMRDGRVKINDVFTPVEDITKTIKLLKQDFSKAHQSTYSVELSIDKDVKMGVLASVRQELREANALRVNYKAY